MAELRIVHNTTPVPTSIDAKVLHVKRNGGTAVRRSILRALARIEEGRPEVDLFLVLPVNQGYADLHLILQPSECADLVRMLEAALQVAVLKLKEGPANG